MQMRQRSRGRLKGILFEHRSISRQDVIELSKLNGRTVTRCMDEFASQGLVEISHQYTSSGHPQIVYTLRQENIFFLVQVINGRELYTILCDNRGFPVCMNRQLLADVARKEEILQLLVAEVDKVITEPVLRGQKLYSAAVSFSPEYVLTQNFRNYVSNVLAKYCSHRVVCGCSDEFMLSQFAINNQLSGRILAVNHKEFSGWHHVAVNDYQIDQEGESRVDKLLNSRTDFCRSGRLRDVLEFNGYLKYFYGKYFSSRKNAFSYYYSEVYSRALYGDKEAQKILEEYASMLVDGVEYINRELGFDHIVLMHSRPIIINKVKELMQAGASSFELYTANFSPCEFIYSPAGYLRRDLFNFEHGRLLKDFNN